LRNIAINIIKMQLNYKIVITGGSGRFGSILKKNYKSNKLF
jgi:hypothetical protein